jgi:hypothetical protein
VPSAADRTCARRRPIHAGSIDGRTADRCDVAPLQASVSMTRLRLVGGAGREARVAGARVTGYEGRACRSRHGAMLDGRVHSGRHRAGQVDAKGSAGVRYDSALYDGDADRIARNPPAAPIAGLCARSWAWP